MERLEAHRRSFFGRRRGEFVGMMDGGYGSLIPVGITLSIIFAGVYLLGRIFWSF